MIIYMYTLHQTMPREPIINHYNSLSITPRNTRINSQGNFHTTYNNIVCIYRIHLSSKQCSAEGVLVLRQGLTPY